MTHPEQDEIIMEFLVEAHEPLDLPDRELMTQKKRGTPDRHGAQGWRAARERGGHMLVQDERTNVFCGRPRFIATARLADQILLLDQRLLAVVRGVRASREAARAAGGRG